MKQLKLLFANRFVSIIAMLWKKRRQSMSPLPSVSFRQKGKEKSKKNDKCPRTVRPIFFASVASAILAKGLSAPQHSTYFVILLLGLDLYRIRKSTHLKYYAYACVASSFSTFVKRSLSLIVALAFRNTRVVSNGKSKFLPASRSTQCWIAYGSTTVRRL